MYRIKFVLLAFIATCVTMALSAQMPVKLPVDSNVRIGHLPNGLTYYIRHNEQPKQRCDFHIAQAVGAVLEEDNQNGLAHFLEHMAFNGTQHFPGKGIIHYFESNGVNFGGNINAYTSIDETVYRLSDVPTTREGLVDSALLVMHDWACGLLLLPEEIDAERGVIMEEWRTRNNANGRMNNIIRSTLYPNSQYGKRDVIGDTAVILHFEYDALRAYYNKWYGPDNQAIIVVGDIDVDAIEKKIQALWEDVPERVNRGERPIYTVDFFNQPAVAIAKDVEAPSSRIQVQYLHPQLPDAYSQTDMSYMLDVIHDVINHMFNLRLSELAMKPEAPFVSAGGYYVSPFKLKDAFIAVTAPKEGRETEALKDLLVQIEKMKRFGFTQSELDLAKNEILSGYEKAYNERNTRKNRTLAQEYVRNFTRDESIPGITWEYNFIKEVLPQLDLANVNQVAAQYVHPNPSLSITGPDNDKANIPSEEEALNILKEVQEMEMEAPKDNAKDLRLVKRAPKAGKIKKITQSDLMNTTELLLSNGVKVVFKPTAFKNDEILLSAVSEGGRSLIKDTDLPSALIATDLVQYMGLGDLSMTDLQKARAGKTVSVSAELRAYSEAVYGSSAVKDFETMLQLVYLGFSAPRRDDDAYNALMNLLYNHLANKDKNPRAVFGDSVQMMQGNHSPRITLTNLATMDKVSLERAMAVYRERFANPADFTFVFVGNIDPTDPAVQKQVCQWLGGLKTKRCREQFKDVGIRTPEGVAKNYFERPMQTKKASNRIVYSARTIPYNLTNHLNAQVIGRVLSMRYLESVREREGGSYGVSCRAYMTPWPVPTAYLLMQFDTDPEKQDRLLPIIYEEIQTVVKDGPRADDLMKAKESMLKDYQENLEKNDWWLDKLEDYYLFGADAVSEYSQTVENITAETVQSLLKQIVDENNVYEVVMTPAAE